MKQKLLLFAFTLISAMLCSQAQNMAFEDFKTNDGTQNFFYKNIVKTDASGNIYTLGATTTSNSTTDILLTKKNSSGVTLWSKQINGTANYHDFGSGLAITSSGDVYITGAITNNTTTLAPELIIRKYNSSGSQQFSTTYSGAGYGAVGKDIVVDGSGNSYITGAEYNSGFNADILTIAFGSTGTQIWTDLFDNNSLNDGGVKIGFRSNKVTVTGAVTQSTNNYKIATLTFTASTGVRSETITLGSTMTSSVEIVTGMTTDASGNTYICGATEVSGQGFNMYVAKLTSSLTIAWQQTYNGVSNLDDQAKGIQVDGSGNVYITGYSTSSTLGKEIRTIKYNSSGTLQWNNVINSTGNNPDQAFDMEMDASSNIYVCGSISSDINQLDYYTVKYNSGGTKIWDIQTDGNHLNDQATNLAIDSLNNIIVTGESETSTGSYVYSTCKYIQKDVITPTDYSLEVPNPNMLFYPNKGQLKNTSNALVPDVKFYTNNTSPIFMFKDNSQSFMFAKVDAIASTIDTLQRIDLTFDKVLNTKIYPMAEQKDGSLNYFLAHTGSGITSVLGNQRLVTPNIYNNIDLMSTSNDVGIKYYFIVKPGGNPADIQLSYTGATSFSLNGSTNALSINSKIGSLTFVRPLVYQITASNATVAVTSFTPAWATNGASNRYKFNLGTYTSSLTLVIEVEQGISPAKVQHLGGPEWSTPFGGSGYDEAFDIKTDSSGNSYWVGTTNGSIPKYNLFPGIFTAPQGDFDMFVAKFGTADALTSTPQGYIPTGDKLMWSTYWGGEGEDKGYAIDVEGTGTSGEIYLTGYTKSSNFHTSSVSGFYNDTYSGNSDAFVVKLKYGPTSLINAVAADIWATFLGGAGDDIGNDIKVNGSQIFVGGSTTSVPTSCTCLVPNASGDDGFPVYNATFHATQSGGTDGFLVNLDTTTGLTKATYIGGSSNDVVNEVSLNGSDVYLVGSTNSTNTTFSPITLTGTNIYNQGVIGGAYDAFFGRVSTSGNWLSYYGGSGDDYGNTIKVLFTTFAIGGLTKSTSACDTCTCAVPSVGQFPVCNKAFSTTYSSFKGGNSDGYLAEFDFNGVYKWGTYMGGDGDDNIASISFGGDGYAMYAAGETNTTNKTSLYFNDPSAYDVTTGTFAVPNSTSSDGYMTVFDGYQQNLYYSDYCLGSYWNAPVVDMKSNINAVHIWGSHHYYAGKTTNLDFLIHNGSGTAVNNMTTPPSTSWGAYNNAQTWQFNAGQTINTSAGVVNYNPDAVMIRFNLNSMPMTGTPYVGIKEIPKNNNALIIFPNPTNGVLNIFSKLDYSDNLTLEIINLLGQTVYSEDLGNKTQEFSRQINLSDYSAGVYNINIKGSKTNLNKLFVKQ